MSELSPRRQKFADLYDGNGTQTARLAGYKGNDHVLAQTARELLRNPDVAQVIKERQAKEKAPLIASRQQRQAFWTEIMNSTAEETRDRLKASELLGRSEADFTDKVELTDPVADRLKKARERAAKRG